MIARPIIIPLLALIACSATGAVPTGFSRVDGPDLSQTNDYYVGNRAPLLPARFIPLPLGSVEPRGWLREMLQRQRLGLTGHLGEISIWLEKQDNAWLSTNGKGKYGWEEMPYWLKGYIELAYVFEDPKMIAEARVWVEGALGSQRANGDFGPDQRFEDDGTRDYWANMIMLFCLQSYYDQSGDKRVLDLMTRYFAHQLTVADSDFLTHYWQKMRGGDNLDSIYWLYNRTGNPELLKVAEKVHRCTANWRLKDDLPNWHNVNIAQCFREPAQFHLQSHNPADLQAAYANFHEVRRRYGQVPGGMFGSDENCRPGFDDPRQATETCGFVEQMFSDARLFQITGDPFWVDHCEEVAFNSYPAAVMPDFKALRYLTSPNMVVSDSKNHAPGVQNSGPFMMMNPFSSRCCQHNHSHGWPYFNKHLWMATPDNGVCAALYSASVVRIKVGDGATATLTADTRYPFEESVRIKIAMDRPSEFPLYLRVPAWCAGPQVILNGQPLPPAEGRGRFLRIQRSWKNGDTVTLKLPMTLAVKKWTGNHDSVSVSHGPLTFSLKIGERYEKRDSKETAIGDSKWQAGADPAKWPSFEIHPTTPWNYGLILDPARPETSFKLKHGKWPADNFPFTTKGAPLSLEVEARRIPEWTLDRHDLCAVLQDSPVLSTQPVETVVLIPMGAARLRISAFPVTGQGPEAKRWEAPARPRPGQHQARASHCFGADTVEALSDGLVADRSGDESIPRFTWWNHCGTTEWVQYEFQNPRKIAGVEVFWFDDTGHGQCRVPKAWRVLYRTAEGWKPVVGATPQAVADQWSRFEFTPVTTSQLRLEADLQPDFSGGILEWQVR